MITKPTVLMIALLSISLVTSWQKVKAQEAIRQDTLHYFLLRDGSAIQGKVISQTEKEYVVQTANFGVITVVADSIEQVEIRLPESLKKGKYWFKNPNATRYFLGPTAIPMEKGEGYFQNSELFFCALNVGISSNVSIGGGIDVLTPFIEDAGGPIAMANLKAGFKIGRNLHLGASTLLLRAPVEDVEKNKDWSFYVIEYGLLTVGNEDNNLTLGAGYNLKNGNPAPAPSFTVSGITRITPRFCLLSENWIVPGTNYEYDVFTGENVSSGFTYKAYVS